MKAQENKSYSPFTHHPFWCFIHLLKCIKWVYFFDISIFLCFSNSHCTDFQMQPFFCVHARVSMSGQELGVFDEDHFFGRPQCCSCVPMEISCLLKIEETNVWLVCTKQGRREKSLGIIDTNSLPKATLKKRKKIVVLVGFELWPVWPLARRCEEKIALDKAQSSSHETFWRTTQSKRPWFRKKNHLGKGFLFL